MIRRCHAETRGIGDQPSTTILRWLYEHDCATPSCANRWFSIDARNGVMENMSAKHVINKEAELSITPKTKRYRVSLSGPPMKFPGFGTASTSYSAFNGPAASKDDAVEQARHNARTNGRGFAHYADGKASVVELFTWAVTLRGKDKRKRETYHVIAADEHEALRHVGHNTAANRFAGYYGPRKNNGHLVTKIVKK